MDVKTITETIKSRQIISRTIIMIISVFILALNYNLFLLSNNFVIGGTSGLAIIIQKIFNIEPSFFIFITSLILIIMSIIFLGFESTSKTIIGSLLYPIFISLTSSIAKIITPYLNFESTIIIVLLAGLLSGLANGFIYKTGFNTGGSDVLMKIINKYYKISEGKSLFIVNLIIMLSGAFLFGINKFIYALIILFINTKVIDRILIGISNSKLFFIHTKKINEVKKFIIEELNSGVTIFNATGGFSKQKNDVLMCVVKTNDYYLFKDAVLEIDPHAFFVINDCYEVSGGVKGKNFPFI